MAVAIASVVNDFMEDFSGLEWKHYYGVVGKKGLGGPSRSGGVLPNSILVRL